MAANVYEISSVIPMPGKSHQRITETQQALYDRLQAQMSNPNLTMEERTVIQKRLTERNLRWRVSICRYQRNERIL